MEMNTTLDLVSWRAEEKRHVVSSLLNKFTISVALLEKDKQREIKVIDKDVRWSDDKKKVKSSSSQMFPLAPKPI